MEYDGYGRRPAGRYSVLSDHGIENAIPHRRWRCDQCADMVTTEISPVECVCGGEYVLAPQPRAADRRTA